MEIEIEGKVIGRERPTYFIADLAANHDGDLERAKELIHLASESGADAAKFQNFQAETIVSDYGFKALGSQQSHQASWKKSVFEIYKDASLPLDWIAALKETCKQAGIAYFTSPYSFDLVDAVNAHIPAFKIGSGDITWPQIIEYMAAKGKPVLLATGAATTDEVCNAVRTVLAKNKKLVLMQCNTNYTADEGNFRCINLNVLKTYQTMFPEAILGLSDHTHGCVTVLGAVALGARVIEKHFTDDTGRNGPDHGFSMTPETWKEMVARTRELEMSLGDGIKKVEDNELQTVVLQRRSIRANTSLKKGTPLAGEALIALRPCPEDGLAPYYLEKIVGKKLRRDVKTGEHIRWSDLA